MDNREFSLLVLEKVAAPSEKDGKVHIPTTKERVSSATRKAVDYGKAQARKGYDYGKEQARKGYDYGKSAVRGLAYEPDSTKKRKSAEAKRKKGMDKLEPRLSHSTAVDAARRAEKRDPGAFTYKHRKAIGAGAAVAGGTVLTGLALKRYLKKRRARKGK